jgi:hypothetical protein
MPLSDRVRRVARTGQRILRMALTMLGKRFHIKANFSCSKTLIQYIAMICYDIRKLPHAVCCNSAYCQYATLSSSLRMRTPNHSNRSQFSLTASSFFWVLRPVNWLAICKAVHSPLLLRSRSRMAASWVLGWVGYFCCSTGAMIAVSSSTPTPSRVVWVGLAWSGA